MRPAEDRTRRCVTSATTAGWDINPPKPLITTCRAGTTPPAPGRPTGQPFSHHPADGQTAANRVATSANRSGRPAVITAHARPPSGGSTLFGHDRALTVGCGHAQIGL